MVRKASVVQNKEAKRIRGRPKKATVPETGAGKRKLLPTDESDEEPHLKKDKISLQIDHAFESAQTGVMLALGQGEFGQLGLGEDVTSRKKPALVGHEIAGKKLKKVAAGGMHTVCLTEDHEVYTFGCNDEGALGRPISDDSEEFEAGLVAGALEGINVIDITVGDSHTAALSDTGVVYLWGCFRDNRGKLGLVHEWEGNTSPIQLDSVKTPVVKISSGCDHLAVITNDGKVFTLGCGEQGQLGRLSKYSLSRGGRRSAEDQCLRPKQLHAAKVKGKPGKPIFNKVFCGSYCTYVVTTTNDVFAFGLNNYNQLGIPDEDNKYMPTHIPSLSDKKWKMISGGLHHTILLDDKGDVYSLGRGDYGRLGLGEKITIANEPTKVEELKDIVHIAAGPCVSFAVDRHGKAYGWGMGTNLQLTTGVEDDEWTPVELCGKQLEERAVLTAEGGGQHTVLLACNKSEIINGEAST